MRTLALFSCLCVATWLSSQNVEPVDSLRHDTIGGEIPLLLHTNNGFVIAPHPPALTISPLNETRIPSLPSFRLKTSPQRPYLPLNDRSFLSGSQSQMNLPTMGNAIQSSLMYNHRLTDAITLSGGMYAGKYRFYNDLSNVAGLRGAADFRIDENLRLRVYGTYSFTNKSVPVPAAPFMPNHSYGGAFEWKFSEHWGVGVGMERWFDVSTRRWETSPIVYPIYYK
ncbi:MAG: hypothetical protein LBM61_08260 [Prevotellaceae bacterium]|jgi:hypothetical protein|nr:hypothetical protein [Prevotellaceae bacterium]